MPDQVQIPGKSISEDGDDLLTPITTLLDALNMLPSKADLDQANAGSTLGGPPQSVAIIESGATALSKWWSVAAAGLGGTAAISTAVSKFWAGQHGGERIALIASMAGVVGAALVSIAIIVASDVRGRAAGGVAQYNARAQIASQFISAAVDLSCCASNQQPRGSSPPDGVASGVSAAVAGNAPGNSNPNAGTTPRLSGGAVAVMLAAAQKQALVHHEASDTQGHIGGVRLTSQGIEVRMDGGSDASYDSSWYPPDEFDRIDFNYPYPPE